MERMARFSTHLILFLAKEVNHLHQNKITPVFWVRIKQNTSKILLELRGMAVLGKALGWSSSKFLLSAAPLGPVNISLYGSMFTR